MEAHRSRYQAARENVLSLIGEVIGRMAEYEPMVYNTEPRKAILRINRDIRFSKNKTPYKHYMGAIFNKDNAHRSYFPDYYLHIEPGNSFLAGGCWYPTGEAMRRIRSKIDLEGDRFQAILDAPEFKSYFGGIEGEVLKTSPRDYDKDHPHIDLLRHKTFSAMHRLTDEEVLSPKLADEIADGFLVFKPFYDFMVETFDIEEDKMGDVSFL